MQSSPLRTRLESDPVVHMVNAVEREARDGAGRACMYDKGVDLVGNWWKHKALSNPYQGLHFIAKV